MKNVKVKAFGYDDCFVKHGKVEELEQKYKLDAQSINLEIIKDVKKSANLHIGDVKDVQ